PPPDNGRRIAVTAEPLPTVSRLPHAAVPDTELAADITRDRSDGRAASRRTVAGRDPQIDRLQCVEFMSESVEHGATQSRYGARTADDEQFARACRVVDRPNAADEFAGIGQIDIVAA